MQRESISQTTFAKGVGAAAILAASLGTLTYTEYSPNAVSYNFVPGTYTADAQGMDGPVTVTITVDDSSITEITVDVSGETAGIGAEIGDTVVGQIMESQSSLIDGVAGATVSSDAVKSALDAAITKAESGDTSVPEAASEEAPEEAASEITVSYGSYTPGTYTASAQGMESEVAVTATFDETSITDVTLDVSGETAGIGAEAGDGLKEAILAAQSADFDGVSGATVTSDAARAALTDIFVQATGGAQEAAEAVSEAAGDETDDVETASGNAYTASAQGIESEVTVTGTFDGEALVDVAIDVSGETAGIGAEVGDPLSEAFLDAQSADVDGIAGATITSDAVKTAMADVFAQAAGSADGAAEAVSEAADDNAEEAEAVSEAAGDEADDEETASGNAYTASAQGIESEVTVTGTFDGDALVDVAIDVSGETAGIGAEVGDPLSEAFLDAQSADVDGIAGATITSDAVKTAMADVFAQAAGSADEAAEAVSEAAGEADAAQITLGSYVPGTYTASAPGKESDVVVTITFDETSVTDVSIDVSGETKNIGDAIGERMQDAVLAAQSYEVDSITGATVTSDAVKASLLDIFSQASGSTAENN